MRIKAGECGPTKRVYEICVVALPLILAFFCQTFVKSTVIQIVLCLVALTVALASSLKQEDRLGLNAGTVFLIAFYLWVLADQNAAFQGSQQANESMKWLLVFGSMLIVTVLTGQASKQKWHSSLWSVIVAIGLFYALVTIASWAVPGFHDFIYRHFFANGSYHAARWQAGFTNHYSTNGMYLALGLLACIPRLADKNKNIAIRVIPALIILFALLLTAKRAHLVFSLFAMVAALCIFGSRKSASTSFKVLVVIAIGILGFYLATIYIPDLTVVLDRIAQAQDDDTYNGRSSFYEICLAMWGQSPIVGSGMGSYTTTFNMTSLGAWYIGKGFTGMKAHNCYLQVLAEQGIIGLVLLVAVFVTFLVGSIRLLLWLNRHDPGNYVFRISLTASVAVQLFFVIYCLTGNPLYDMQMYIPYLLGCGAYVWIRGQNPRYIAENRKGGSAKSRALNSRVGLETAIIVGAHGEFRR